MVQTLSRARELPAAVREAVETWRDEADALRRLPDPLIEALRSAGAFRLTTPREYGGAELGLTDTVAVLEELARIDGPVAWNVWNGNTGFAAALLSEAGADRVWGGDPVQRADPVVVNSARPTGRAVPVKGGYALTGRWDLVSGIDSANWVALFGMVEAAQPDVRVFFLPRSAVGVLDTWQVTGMRGTGSNSVVVDGAVVPSELVVSPFAPSRIDRPLYRIPAFTNASTGCAAVVLGIARAGLDALVELATDKLTDNGATLAHRAHAQAAIAGADAALRAASLLLRTCAAEIDAAVLDGTGGPDGSVTPALRGAIRAAMCHAAQTSRDVLTRAYVLGSSSSLSVGSRLERAFRDGMVAAQHGLLAATMLEPAGRIQLGIDVGVPIY
ncbi:acyl-CoA dehydrogenase family protein [Pseudonocardia sp.]|uniref:acyl-CoA dehydrogenase family protein n=1 Tax=Pseudonocardia sp. TaxID=60912 RepID=UPI003D135C18